MPGSPMALRRQLIATALMCLPGAAVLAALWLAGALSLAAGAAGLAGLAAIAWPLVRFYLADIAAFARFIELLASGQEPARPEFKLSVVADELSSGVAALHQGWLQQRQSLAAVSMASKRILDSLPDPLIAVDRQRRITQINARAQEVFGPVQAERDLAAVLRHPQILAAVDAAIAEGRSASVEFILTGTVARVLQAHVVSLDRPAGDGTAVLLSFHDLTTLRQAERMRADFVANASHELKTPISTLIGFIETLRGPARDDAAARERFLGIMDEHAQRMARLVNDLLSLSDIELREHSRPSGALDVAGVVRSVLDLLELRARQRGVTLKLDAAAGLPPVMGDRDELAQVFQNLIDNAIKYGGSGTQVNVSIQQASDPAMVAVAVADQGDGIAPEHLPRLTERFYRVDTARSRQLGGTGLGLAIVKHIVNRHRGRLQIDSVPGQGSTFTVLLPVATGEVAKPPAPVTESRRRA